MAATWILHDNGTYDLCFGPIMLAHCYPSFDCEPVRPVEVSVSRTPDGGQVVYRLASGALVLELGQDTNGPMVEARLRGVTKAPHWVYPLAGARVSGVRRWFKQGLGFAGPSGLLEIPSGRAAWSLDSYMVTGFTAASGQTVAIGALRHGDFTQRSTLYNRQRRRGLVDRHIDTDEVLFEAGFATECVSAAGDEFPLPSLHIVAGDTPFATMHHLARLIAEAAGVRLRHPPRYHYCSWYEYEKNFSLERLREMLEGLRKLKQPAGFQTIQIDDGYCTRGDWLTPNELWPGGLETAFKLIREHGYEPGIWVGPFMVSSESELFRKHPDWVVHGHNGEPLEEWGHKGEFALDTSNPDAFEYLRTVFRTLRSWGATVYKTDFLDWGLKDSLTVRRHTPGRTSVQYYRDVLAMIRKEIGADSYWLACIAPFAPFVGFADGARVANDVGPRWGEGSVGNMLQESASDQYFNNVFWQNDNDVLYLRAAGEPRGAARDPALAPIMRSKLSQRELVSIALWNAILGGSINTSDRLHLMKPGRRALWRFLRPLAEPRTARLPYWGSSGDILVAVLEHAPGQAWAVLGLNPTRKALRKCCPMVELTGAASAWCFAWQPGKSRLLGKRDTVEFALGSHESALLYVSTAKQAPGPDLGLYGAPVPGGF